jgi:predicted nucleic acid-binding protein
VAQLFGSVLIPSAVLSELSSPRRSEAMRAFAAHPPAWLDVRTPRIVETIPGLHAGEQAALSLAAEVGADLLLMDEKEGRLVATARRLRVAGTVGVLERAAEQGLLNLREAFDRLKASDFWVSPALLETRLEAFEQRQAHIRARDRGIKP